MPPKAKAACGHEMELKKRGLSLYKFQKEGIKKMLGNYASRLGCINADEMGLGKTCQAIVSLANLYDTGAGPFLVISPLSVCHHWETEVNRFGCGKLKPIKYVGHKAELAEITSNMEFSRASVFIVAYHTFADNLTHRRLAEAMGDGLKFSVVVVDEAQAIKNPEVQIAKQLDKHYKISTYFLLTGTPIQNNLAELYSLLCYCDKAAFKAKGLEDFLEKYKDNVEEVSQLLKPYIIRRTKEVLEDLPECEEVVLYHGMSPMQLDMYKNVISKNADAFRHNVMKVSMTNIHMELRKVAIHPYLIHGVEPQPFEEGEHMVEASGKLQVLERLLCYLKEKSHRCLMFSFYKISLDIVQDYLQWRGFGATRIDGNTLAADRTENITAFQEGKGQEIGESEEPWIFMATTKTGGVGLNLTAADTVIFLDSDWNPQIDIQAMARCHRIGQDKPVRVIRLVTRFTIEQYMLVRARAKLKLSDAIMEADEAEKSSAVDVNAAIRAGIADLLDQKTSKTFTCTDEELEKVIGATNEDGEWSPLTQEQKDGFLNIDDGERDVDKHDHRTFQGVSYRISDRDDEAFAKLLLLQETVGRRRRDNVDYTGRKPLVCRIEKTKENVKAWLEKGAIDDDEEEPTVKQEKEND